MKKTRKYAAWSLFAIWTMGILYVSIWHLRSAPIEIRLFPFLIFFVFPAFILALNPKSKTPPDDQSSGAI